MDGKNDHALLVMVLDTTTILEALVVVPAVELEKKNTVAQNHITSRCSRAQKAAPVELNPLYYWRIL